MTNESVIFRTSAIYEYQRHAVLLELHAVFNQVYVSVGRRMEELPPNSIVEIARIQRRNQHTRWRYCLYPNDRIFSTGTRHVHSILFNTIYNRVYENDDEDSDMEIIDYISILVKLKFQKNKSLYESHRNSQTVGT